VTAAAVKGAAQQQRATAGQQGTINASAY
jgi:hypothetical protein